MKAEWLQTYLIDAVEKKLCTKINCTTCGAMEFRNGLLAGLDPPREIPRRVRFDRAGVVEITEALAGVTADDLRLHPQYEAIRCILYDLWSGMPMLDNEIEVRLKGSWAGHVLQKMKEHHQAAAAARELQSPTVVRRHREEKQRKTQEQHLLRLKAKIERDRLWRVKQGKVD